MIDRDTIIKQAVQENKDGEDSTQRCTSIDEHNYSSPTSSSNSDEENTKKEEVKYKPKSSKHKSSKKMPMSLKLSGLGSSNFKENDGMSSPDLIKMGKKVKKASLNQS